MVLIILLLVIWISSALGTINFDVRYVSNNTLHSRQAGDSCNFLMKAASLCKWVTKTFGRGLMIINIIITRLCPKLEIL